MPSVEDDSVELIAARVDGAWMIQRTRRNGADLAVHARAARDGSFGVAAASRRFASAIPALAPIVFSWLAGRGANATRLDPHDVARRAGACARGSARCCATSGSFTSGWNNARILSSDLPSGAHSSVG